MDTRTLTLTLPAEIVAELNARVTAGLAQDIEAGIVDAIERTRGDDRDDPELAHWVRTEGMARWERLQAGLSRTISYDELVAGIEARRQQRLTR